MRPIPGTDTLVHHTRGAPDQTVMHWFFDRIMKNEWMGYDKEKSQIKWNELLCNNSVEKEVCAGRLCIKFPRCDTEFGLMVGTPPHNPKERLVVRPPPRDGLDVGPPTAPTTLPGQRRQPTAPTTTLPDQRRQPTTPTIHDPVDIFGLSVAFVTGGFATLAPAQDTQDLSPFTPPSPEQPTRNVRSRTGTI